MSSDEEIFNQINKNYFNSDLEKIGEKHISSGTYNFVIIVKNKKTNTQFALRISKNFVLEKQIESYGKILKLYKILKSIFPKITAIYIEKPFILYEYFEYNVYDYLEQNEDNSIFENIIDQCIYQINFVYNNKIRCTDIKPNNFVLKFDKKIPIVKMIDIDDCFIDDDTTPENIKNLLLLMSFYQFYIFFKTKKFTNEKQKYILTKIKENTMFFDSETKKEYNKIFDNISIDNKNVYYNHFYVLNFYYNHYCNKGIEFDFIWNELNDSSSDLPSPPKKQKKADGKRKRSRKTILKNKSKKKIVKKSKKRSRRK
jgi:hypothetical protein